MPDYMLSYLCAWGGYDPDDMLNRLLYDFGNTPEVRRGDYMRRQLFNARGYEKDNRECGRVDKNLSDEQLDERLRNVFRRVKTQAQEWGATELLDRVYEAVDDLNWDRNSI